MEAQDEKLILALRINRWDRWVVEPQLEVSKNRISLVQSNWASSYLLHGFPDFQRRTPDKYARIKMNEYDLLAGFKSESEKV